MYYILREKKTERKTTHAYTENLEQKKMNKNKRKLKRDKQIIRYHDKTITVRCLSSVAEFADSPGKQRFKVHCQM